MAKTVVRVNLEFSCETFYGSKLVTMEKGPQISFTPVNIPFWRSEVLFFEIGCWRSKLSNPVVVTGQSPKLHNMYINTHTLTLCLTVPAYV